MKKFFKSLFSQKGQTLVLYALLASLMFMVGGAAVDLGWYYYNVAKLQNAADAAAMAGALKLESDNDKNPKLVSSYPDENKRWTVDNNSKKSSADKQAEAYLKKNWDTKNKPITNSDKFFLYEGKTDSNLYYVVNLKSDFTHLFSILDSENYGLGKFDIVVNSVAKLDYYFEENQPEPDTSTDDPPSQPEAPPEIKTELKKIVAKNVVSGNWELEKARESNYWKEENAQTELKKNPNNYFIWAAKYNIYPSYKKWLNYNSKANMTDKSPYYRYAEVSVAPGNGEDKTTLSVKGEKFPDSITLGFRQDIVRVENGKNTVFLEDWDIRNPKPPSPYDRKTEVMYININKKSNEQYYWNESCDLRIHNIFNFKVFEPRFKEDENTPSDILWVRVESEAFLPLYMLGINKSSHVQYKSVRQIILNMNEDNTVKDSDGKFKYRPVVLFYLGPEKIDINSTVRDSKPVILNLNKNFRGILFAPYSPVILTGNGHFQGFIVAKEYLTFKEGTDSEHHHKINHSNCPEMWINDYGEVLTERTDITKYGTYDSLNIESFEEYGYNVADDSLDNLLIYSK